MLCINVLYKCCSVQHHQAGPLHAGDDAADVQDPGAQRPHPGVLAVRALPRRHQVLRRPGHHAGPPPGRLLPLHLKIQGEFLGVAISAFLKNSTSEFALFDIYDLFFKRFHHQNSQPCP